MKETQQPIVKTQQTFWVYLDAESELEDLELPAKSGELESN